MIRTASLAIAAGLLAPALAASAAAAANSRSARVEVVQTSSDLSKRLTRLRT